MTNTPARLTALAALVALMAPGPGAGAAPGRAALDGEVGLLRMGTAEAGSPGFLRLGLGAEYFSAERFLLTTSQGTSDQHRRLGGTLSLGLTPVRFWELHASLAAAANRNRRFCDGAGGCQPDESRGDPEILRTFGDLGFGTKVARPVGRGFSLAAGLELELPSAVSGLAFAPEASRLSAEALVSWDPGAGVSEARGRFLPRLHLSVGYTLDESAERIDLPALADASRVVSAFAYGVAGNRVRTAVGLDWRSPTLPGGLVLRPLGEYHLEVITEDPDPGFSGDGGRDQQWLTTAVALETGGGWSFTAGVDVPLRSAGPRYGPRLPPWNALFVVGYGLFAGQPSVVTRTVTVEKPVAPAPREGQASGWVRAADGPPIAGATVEVLDVPRAKVATDADGGFRTGPLAPGTREIVVSAPGFRPGRQAVTIAVGQEARPEVTLQPLGATVEGRLTDLADAAVLGRIRLSEQAPPSEVDAQGRFQIFLAPGAHRLIVEAEGYLTRGLLVEIADGPVVPVAVPLRPRPPAPGVMIRDGLVMLGGQVEFTDAAADPALGAQPGLAPATQALLDEVVDLLLTRAAETPRLRVEAFVKAAAQSEDARRLSERRAAAVADYLAARGVPERRLLAVGLGSGRWAPTGGKARARSLSVALRILD